MTRISDFSDTDEQYLTSRHADYHQTPAAEKEVFREQCAKHIIMSRDLALDDAYLLDLFLTKVRNWFQNNAPVKKARLPLKINHDFTAECMWGMVHQDEIRDGLLESCPPNVTDDAPHVVVWNAKWKQLWNELSADEKAVYERLAAKWSEEGPDDDLKPEMAERRAVAWMKAITLLFWQQCRMPIFIYGCFEDTKAQLQGATFDTSLLFEDTKEGKGKPTFHRNKDWATDFRHWFYEYFTPYVRPDLTSPDAMEYLRTKSKKVVEPFDFDTTEEGWPLLPKGDDVSHMRRQEILRQWFRELYGLACGREVLSVPWSSIVKKPQQFFAPGMLPDSFHIDDPSHIRRLDVIDFFKHVQNIQSPPANPPPDLPLHFEFSNFEDGPENARRYPEALNSGEVEAWQPRRAKKKVRPPTFDALPGATDDEGEGKGEGEGDGDGDGAAPRRSAGRGRFNPGPKFYKDVKHIQRENDWAKARNAKAKAKAQKKAKKAKGRKGKAKGKGREVQSSKEEFDFSDEDGTEEEELDFEAMDNDIPEEETEDKLSGGEEHPPPPSLSPDNADADSGNEVEEALEQYEDVLSSSAVRKNASSSAGPSRRRGDEDPASISAAFAGIRDGPQSSTAASVSIRGAKEPPAKAPVASPSHLADATLSVGTTAVGAGALPPDTGGSPEADVAPADVPPDGPSRLAYLTNLADDRSYREMLQRAGHLLSQTVAIRVQPPLFWASWGYRSPFLPKDAHSGKKSPKVLQGILKFLAKGLPKTFGAMEAQRYCLVMGLALHDVLALQFVEPDEVWPERLPTYLATSTLSFEHLQPLLDSCSAAFRTSAPSLPAAAPPTHSSPAEPLPSVSVSVEVPAPPQASSSDAPAAGGLRRPGTRAADAPRAGPSRTARSTPITQRKAKPAAKGQSGSKGKAKARQPASGEEPQLAPAAATRARGTGGSGSSAPAAEGPVADVEEAVAKPAPRRSTRLRS